MNEHQEIIDYLTSTSDIPADLLKAIQQWLIEHGRRGCDHRCSVFRMGQYGQ